MAYSIKCKWRSLQPKNGHFEQSYISKITFTAGNYAVFNNFLISVKYKLKLPAKLKIDVPSLKYTDGMNKQIQDDRAFSLLHEELFQMFVLCIPQYLLSKSWKKVGSPEKFGRKRGANVLRDLTKKSVNFSTSGTSKIRLLIFFGEVDQ